MNITEGYFTKHGRDENAISIARSAPAFYKGPIYSALAPSWNLLNNYKRGALDASQYEDIYRYETLASLNKEQVRKDLEGKRILCWEAPDKFCHRHIVIRWLNDEI